MVAISKLSRIGLGMYRMTHGIPEHEQAIYKAFQKQLDGKGIINVIDTSTNYGDGGSEMLVGKVLQSPQKDTLSRSEIVLMSKFGYIQGTNMQLYYEGQYKVDKLKLLNYNIPEDQIVKYALNCYHCIHPEFMRDQLHRSLKRTGSHYLDLLFIHNPEYFLLHQIDDGDSADKIKTAQKEMLNRIGETFEALEEAISKDQIRSYGISSNSFSLKRDDKHFLPYGDLIDRAKKASRRVRGTNEHGFKAVQLPGNLLEQEGLKTTAKWAKQNGLKVFINRPLNAFTDKRGFRLASYTNPNYAEAKKLTIDYLKSQINDSDLSLKNIRQLALNRVSQLDDKLHLIENVFRWESAQPALTSVINQFRGDSEIFFALRNFLEAFEAEVRYRDSQRVRDFLTNKCGFKELEQDENKRVEEFAIEFLLKTDVVDTVLMGLTRVSYVDFAREFLKKHDE
ncbi:hypothetical protein G9A89_008248 [Geosiphon pyriformis]|nr:hypothetical protein G9A89_008248 [Geosiphon pyriformis]